MKIQLIYLDTKRGKSHMPLGLGYIASYLVKAGHEVDIMACETLHYDPGHIFKRIYESQAQVFGITAMYPEIDLAIEMVRNIRAIRGDAKVVLGGILATTQPEFALRKTGADIAVKGEAELTVTNLMDCIENDPGSISDVEGIVYRNEDGQISDTGEGEIIDDLSGLLMPAYDLFPMPRLTAQYFYPQDEGSIVADVDTSRGCPFSCNFCYNVSKPRYQEIDAVIEKLLYLIENYGVNTVNFMDENFALNKKRIGQFCEALKKADINITFSATTRADVVTPELVKMLYGAGCRTLNVGLESGDQEMLDRMNKRTTVEQTRKAIETGRRAGIFMEYPCMVGNIGETEESMKKTFELLKELAWGDFQWRVPFFCTPYPGTEIYKYALSRGLIRDDEDFYQKHKNIYSMAVNLTEMPAEYFLRYYDELVEDLKEHYSRQLCKWKPIRPEREIT
ncbi:MAG: B12-binding domain-containing radical SAM protein [Elusimicrobia bacterium]|nr:B12-binding domain-containing radical SAM protein [Elusimicrobiota bacterium]